MVPVQKIILIAGPPGSGKTTQSLRMQEEFHVKHISAGDCLREEMARADSPNAALIKQYINRGDIIPVEVTIELLQAKFHSLGWGKFVIVLDGFPRNYNNVQGWVKRMADSTEILHAICLECSAETSQSRMESRKKHIGTFTFNANNTDRTDDHASILQNRLEVFSNDTMPIMQALKMVGKCTIIDANCNHDVVWQRVKEVLERLQLT
ncbi:bifunctional P-loop containing nucleoside triphosphate hydrolase/Adenylate kinase-UMP-CMP kinase [Babesia duncani]|uniref:Bifunctional P-loop containing nucleoside triphosphate hydrolase/Adenylate kinase-UMP-CMP kinase n=1 Tax=Babesia duncani TaxID=323732 RepID=A0AAD9UN07_9APIC|nr:bifunctional P-loop containing nucleoside triphosphate hydrolase/Adenylate kinase-UMP-CMP kinase [Babesia duncani]